MPSDKSLIRNGRSSRSFLVRRLFAYQRETGEQRNRDREIDISDHKPECFKDGRHKLNLDMLGDWKQGGVKRGEIEKVEVLKVQLR